MDSRGQMYAKLEALEDPPKAAPEEVGNARLRRSQVRRMEEANRRALVMIADPAIAKELEAMPMRKRRVFYGSRKKGHPESVSLAKARAAR